MVGPGSLFRCLDQGDEAELVEYAQLKMTVGPPGKHGLLLHTLDGSLYSSGSQPFSPWGPLPAVKNLPGQCGGWGFVWAPFLKVSQDLARLNEEPRMGTSPQGWECPSGILSLCFGSPNTSTKADPEGTKRSLHRGTRSHVPHEGWLALGQLFAQCFQVLPREELLRH